jgi:DNA-binding Lrp family transcriptional regulator
MFQKLVPSKYHFFTRFKDLDEIDLKIIFTMLKECPEGPRNIRKISAELNLPQQTVNYRVLRFTNRDFVRFRAVVNEKLLGLTNYAVLATVKPGLLLENKTGSAVNAGTFLTCYPVWRVLEEVVGGESHGFFVQYSIPFGKEDDLKLFLSELEKIGCVKQVHDFCEVTESSFNRPSLNSYLAIREAVKQRRKVSFNWQKWADDFDEAKEGTLPEEMTQTKRIAISYEHLLVLFHLERNLREKFVNIARSMEEPSRKVVKWYNEIVERNLIEGCRAEIYAVDPLTSMHLVTKFEFADESALRKFVSQLNEIPYLVTYQKLTRRNALYMHLTIPTYEYSDFRNAFEKLSRKNILLDVKQYLGNYYSKFDNIMLYEAFSKTESNWAFSFELVQEALKRRLDDTQFRF